MTMVTTGAPIPVGDSLVSCYFSVSLDGRTLGNWTEVELGGVDVEVESLEEGGNQSFAYRLPGRLKYANIKLSRVMDTATSQVADWFSGMTGAVRRTHGQIVAYSPAQTPLITWSFVEAIPVHWTLPTLSAKDPNAAIESLEIAHQGFTRA